VTNNAPAAANSIEARRDVRRMAERRWRRAQHLPKVCGILVLATIGFLPLVPLMRIGPVLAGGASLLCVVAMLATNRYHRATYMAVQKSRGIAETAAERAYDFERPFA
jgi:hypothetical protein